VPDTWAGKDWLLVSEMMRQTNVFISVIFFIKRGLWK
jgi:hypothetical protein